MFLRSAAFVLACALAVLAFPAVLRAERAAGDGAGRGRVLYEAGRAVLAIAAAAALGVWLAAGG